MKKATESRFSGLVPAAADSITQEDFPPVSLTQTLTDNPVDPTVPADPELKELAKSQNADYKRTTVYLPKALLKQIKIAAAHEEIDASDLIAIATQLWLDTRSDK